MESMKSPQIFVNDSLW